ncbi:hypothetical protein CEXT_715191 [Caerostris extrusa]|uniref:Uncharacterized protein n=1 Tax=Caerostris extrusa TaxID=172846 RepID=A0AAV4X1N7_CAEEX|nr:hypothetical protein CEXT_715191 [Caerostris extrusa]
MTGEKGFGGAGHAKVTIGRRGRISGTCDEDLQTTRGGVLQESVTPLLRISGGKEGNKRKKKRQSSPLSPLSEYQMTGRNKVWGAAGHAKVVIRRRGGLPECVTGIFRRHGWCSRICHMSCEYWSERKETVEDRPFSV